MSLNALMDINALKIGFYDNKIITYFLATNIANAGAYNII